MKRILNWAIVLILIGGSSLLGACSSDDNPSGSSPVAEINREVLASHFKSDATVLQQNLDGKAVDVSTQAMKQLLTLMGKSRYFKEDMKKMMLLLTVQNAADKNATHGMRVVFDSKGNYKVGSGEGMAFIFPANIDGYDGTLYKLSMKSNANWDEMPTVLQVTLSCMFGDKEVVLTQSKTNIKMNSDYPGIVAMTLGTFSYTSTSEYSLPDTSDGSCTMNMSASRDNSGSVSFSCDYEQNDLDIFNMNLSFSLPVDYAITSIGGTIDTAEDKVLDATLLDDLFIKGDVDGNMQITCGKDGTAIPMQLIKEQDGDLTRMLPTFALDYTSVYTPLRGVVDAETYRTVIGLYDRIVAQTKATSTTYSDLLTVLMQILPIGAVAE